MRIHVCVHACVRICCRCSEPSECCSYNDDDTQELFGYSPSVIEDKHSMAECDVPNGVPHYDVETPDDMPYDRHDSGGDNLLDELFS